MAIGEISDRPRRAQWRPKTFVKSILSRIVASLPRNTDTSQLFQQLTIAVDTRSLTCGSSMKRGHSLKKKPGEHRRSTSKLAYASQQPYPCQRQRADRLKIQNPREECTSVFLRILWKRQRAVAPRSPLKKKDSFSCRHCFPVFSRAAPEWLYHFQSRGRQCDSYAHIMDLAWLFQQLGGRPRPSFTFLPKETQRNKTQSSRSRGLCQTWSTVRNSFSVT